MLELTNLSNADCDVEKVLENDAGTIPAIVREHGLDGIEFMICGPWDRVMHPPQYIKGVHLLFWPCWLDFWRGKRAVLLSEFGSEENIRAYYGSLDVGDWVEAWKRNLRQAVRCHPHYVVFHVAHNRTSEMYTREFSASDEDVIRATAELVNQITSELPQGCTQLRSGVGSRVRCWGPVLSPPPPLTLPLCFWSRSIIPIRALCSTPGI